MKRLVLSLLCASALLIGLTANPHAAEQPPAAATNSGPPQLTLLPALQPMPPAATTTTTARLGLVDINRISMESALGKAAQAKIKAQQSKLQKQVDAKKRQLEKTKADIERQLPTLSPPQREAKARDFQKKVEEFQKFGMNAEKGMMETQEKLTKELLAAVEQAATALGKLKGLSAVVVKRELIYLGSGVEALDISEDVVKLVDATSSKK